jgi:hypothetical protein
MCGLPVCAVSAVYPTLLSGHQEEVGVEMDRVRAAHGDAERVCVFCGSGEPSGPFADEMRAQTDALGKELARRGIELVFGGGA